MLKLMEASAKSPVVQVELLIRAPSSQLFEAFVEPAMITQFWLARASARLEPGARVRWDFVVKGASTEIEVKELVKDTKIVIEWDQGERVEWSFAPRAEAETLVGITHSRINGDADAAVTEALDSTQGFTLVLCELKALLERGVRLNLMHDKFPDAQYQDLSRASFALAPKGERGLHCTTRD